jgi:hypothetical protein
MTPTIAELCRTCPSCQTPTAFSSAIDIDCAASSQSWSWCLPPSYSSLPLDSQPRIPLRVLLNYHSFQRQHTSDPGGPPKYLALRRWEAALPQHDLSLTFPEGKTGRYVRFSNMNPNQGEVGWGRDGVNTSATCTH